MKARDFKIRERHLIKDGIKFIIRFSFCSYRKINVINSAHIDFGTQQSLWLNSKEERENFLKTLNLKNFIFFEEWRDEQKTSEQKVA